MKKLAEKFTWKILALPDFLLVTGSFILAYYLRFSDIFKTFLPASDQPPFGNYFILAIISSTLFCFFMARKAEYSHLSPCEPARLDRGLNILSCSFKTLIFLLALSALYRGFLFSRIVCFIGFFITLFTTVIWREAVRILLQNRPCYDIILLCPQEHKDRIMKLLRIRLLGLRDIQHICFTASDKDTIQSVKHFWQLNKTMTILAFQEGSTDSNSGQGKGFFDLLNFCENHHIAFYIIPDLFDNFPRREEMYSFTNIALIRLRDAFIHPVYSVLKRILEVMVSLAVLILGLPIWAAIALGIKVQDNGPVFFTQLRVGLHGKKFRMYKFRTMSTDADQYIIDKIASGELDEEPVFNIRNDSRVTSFGRLLRRYSIDEVPQFLNVLRGEMSIVGPRPEREELVDKYSPVQRRRLKALPGITGLQQVISRGDPSLSSRVKYDLLYIRKQSFWLDVYILLRTVYVVLWGKGLN